MMEYEYTKIHFEKASDALIAYEQGLELYLIQADTACRVFNTCNVVVNYNNLYTRKEKAIDYAKEFTLDTPWMLGYCSCDNGCICETSFCFAYAAFYIENEIDGDKFTAFDNELKSNEASQFNHFSKARHLTKEEEVKYLS